GACLLVGGLGRVLLREGQTFQLRCRPRPPPGEPLRTSGLGVRISPIVSRDPAGWIACAFAFMCRTRIIHRQPINLALQRANSGIHAKSATSPKLSRSELIRQ